MNKDTENKSEITKNKKFRNITKTVVIPLTIICGVSLFFRLFYLLLRK